MHEFIRRLVTTSVLSLLLFLYLYVPVWIVSMSIAVVGLILCIVEWPRLIIDRRWLFLTPLYPVAPFILAIALNQDLQYRHLLLFLILCVSAHDTGAYCTGKLIGTHPLCAAISPGKTWQGIAGGCICVIGMMYCITRVSGGGMPWYVLLIFSALISVVATAGDLFESWLKRKAGIKDAGSLLPGHGGLFDRCDGMMSCMYLMYPLKHLVARLFEVTF